MEEWLKDIDFFFNRHGFSAGQANLHLYLTEGDFGLPLFDPTGFVQAEDLGDFYNKCLEEKEPRGKVVVVSTPYRRGEQTLDTYHPRITSADISAIIYKDYLGEHRFGCVNGRTDPELARDFPDIYAARQEAVAKGERYLWVPPGVDKDGVAGESQAQLCHRTSQLIRDAREMYDDGVRTIIVNAHGSSMRAAQMNILGIEGTDQAWKSWRKPLNCQVDLIQRGEHFPAIYPGSPEPPRKDLMIARALEKPLAATVTG